MYLQMLMQICYSTAIASQMAVVIAALARDLLSQL
jgi:hypothetical protein